MNTRILHCSTSLENYYLCLEDKVAGFTTRFREGGIGDCIYFTVKLNNINYCGARAILSSNTDHKPWEDAEKYIQSFKIETIEYCKPFDISYLKNVDKLWGLKYLRGSKIIKEKEAILFLEETFNANKINSLYKFDLSESNTTIKNDLIELNSYIKDINLDDIDSLEKFNDEDEEKLDILGTFQTIRFKNETDSIRGLEPLVTEYFYQLFQCFQEENSILISNNRLFNTIGLKDDNDMNILGIKGIPDALLITFNKDSNICPLKINLIEYECYGESKTKTTQKFNYLNGTVIPQLIRFASTFSVVTDYKIREKTIEKWITKIIDYIDDDDILMNKIDQWMKELYPNIKQRNITIQLQKELKKAFESNLKIILIIDELTVEQKETITNVIHSFKLSANTNKSRDNNIDFNAYVVRLEQKVGVLDNNANFALSFQE